MNKVYLICRRTRYEGHQILGATLDKACAEQELWYWARAMLKSHATSGRKYSLALADPQDFPRGTVKVLEGYDQDGAHLEEYLVVQAFELKQPKDNQE